MSERKKESTTSIFLMPSTSSPSSPPHFLTCRLRPEVLAHGGRAVVRDRAGKPVEGGRRRHIRSLVFRRKNGLFLSVDERNLRREFFFSFLVLSFHATLLLRRFARSLHVDCADWSRAGSAGADRRDGYGRTGAAPSTLRAPYAASRSAWPEV